MKTLLVLALVLTWPAGRAAVGDTVELRGGAGVLEGKYAGGTATTIRLETAEGVKVIQTADVVALTFTGAGGAAAAAAPAAAVAAPPAAPMKVTVPAGTVLTVKMETQVSSNDPAGKPFTARLVGDVMAGNVSVAKAGSIVQGRVDQSKKAGRLAGKSQLAISLTAVDLGGGRMQPIMTTNFAEAGKGEFRKTARNTAAGALIGNAIDDDGGAGKGAAVGAGVSLIKKGDAVTVPPGALLEFRTTQPFEVTR
jgi:hypothetical protein